MAANGTDQPGGPQAGNQPGEVRLDPRRARVLERLARLGDVPASMYRDMHRLLGDKQFVENAASALMHFAREVKSSVEKVLLPADFVRPAQNGNAAAIAAILKVLELPDDHAIAEIWKTLEPHTFVHRRALGRPLTIEEVRGKFADFEMVIDALLDELERSFARVVYAKIDVLLAKEQPGKDDVSTLRNELPQNSRALGYFFENALVDRWLEPLFQKEIFADEPPYAPWPALHFLQRAAETHPARTAEILSSMPVPVASLHQSQYIELIEKLPVELQPSLFRRMAAELAGSLEDFVARDLANAAKRLADDDPDTALEMTRSLLTLHLRDTRTGSLRDMDADFDVHTYGHVVQQVVPAVIERRPDASFKALSVLLDAILTEAHDEDDLSVVWRPSIAPHPQNHFFNPINHLAEAVRLAAEAAVRKAPERFAEIIAALEAREHTFFRRLAIHLVTLFDDPAGPLAREETLRDDNLQAYELRREYHLLVAKVFPHLQPGDQEAFVRRVLEGPQVEEVKRLEDREYAAEYGDRWTRDRLAWIENALPGDARQAYTELTERRGRYVERDDFYGSMTEWHGPKSPIPAEQLASMPLDALLTYLGRWEPQGIHMVPTREGLGRDLREIAKDRAAEFSANATRFIGQDATYVRSVIAGLEVAVKKGVVIDWRTTLDLSVWVVAQERAIAGRDARDFDNDPHWGWARSAIASLLQVGFVAKEGAGPPKEFREKLWAVLQPITEDPDPDEQRDEQLKDPMSTAINSTRGIAMEAVMRYIVWVREGVIRPDGIDAFEDMLEAVAVLDVHLDPALDSSPAIRAVYGQWLFFLHRMAPGWVHANIDRLFPASDPDLADVVLESYAVYGQYTEPDVRRLLEPIYRRTLARLRVTENAPRTEREAPRRIGQQFVLAYLDGELEIEDGSLLVTFFDAADVATRAETLAFAVNQLEESGEDEEQVTQRCVKLWEWRAEVGEPGELRAFGRWVAEKRLDRAWRLAQLELALTRAGQLDYEFDLMPTLAALASEHPAAVLRATKLAIESADRWRLYSYTYEGDVRRILEACIAVDDTDTRREARAIANALVARDLLEFRDLAEGKDLPESPATEEEAPVGS